MTGPGVLCGRSCHIILKFLAGSMLELVGNPQEYIYIMSLSHLEQILQRISRSKCAHCSLKKIFVWDQPDVSILADVACTKVALLQSHMGHALRQQCGAHSAEGRG